MTPRHHPRPSSPTFTTLLAQSSCLGLAQDDHGQIHGSHAGVFSLLDCLLHSKATQVVTLHINPESCRVNSPFLRTLLVTHLNSRAPIPEKLAEPCQPTVFVLRQYSTIRFKTSNFRLTFTLLACGLEPCYIVLCNATLFFSPTGLVISPGGVQDTRETLR